MKHLVSSKKYVLVLLSGPEPARTEFETLLLKQLTQYTEPVVFVTGTESAKPPAHLPPNITWHNRITHGQLGPLLAGAAAVICRSGYSTLMDLTALQKQAILVPTPGQTEQEYLAKSLSKKQVFHSVKQNKFDINKELNALNNGTFMPLATEGWHSQYQDMLKRWLSSL